MACGCCGGSCTCDEHEAHRGFLERVLEGFESWPALVVALVCLIASFVLVGQGCGHEAATAVPDHGGWRHWVDVLNPAYVSLVLCGLPLLKSALEALFRERRITAALLISSAMVACVSIGQIFAAGEVAFIMALGEKLESFTVNRAKAGLRKLVSLVPVTAHRVVSCPKCRARGELFRDVQVEALAVGDGVVIRPGETIPVDGVVTEGNTSVDQSVMT